MKYLAIIRHADAKKSSTTGEDIDRPLKKRGVHEAEELATLLRERAVAPQLILTSTALRARMTAEIVCTGVGSDTAIVSELPELYHADGRGIVEISRGFPDDAESIFLIGHNPAVTDALNTFCPGSVASMEAGDAAVIEFEAEKWSTAAEVGGSLRAYLESAR